MLLQKHGMFHADACDRIDDFLRSKVAGSSRAFKPIDGENRLQCNAILSDRFKMFFITCKFSGTFDYEAFDDIRIVCPVQSIARVFLKGQTLEIDPRHSNYILPAGTPVTKFHQSEYRVLSVRVSPADLKQKLEALTGRQHREPIEFSQPEAADENFVKFVRRPLFVAARELDQVDAAFHDNLIEEIRAVTLTRLLLFAPHNFSQLLSQPPRVPGRVQMRLAEEYLAAHWDKALDISGLAKAAGVSARTILRHFRDSYGETPREHMKKIRLERARTMLHEGPDATTVMDVALRCGFSSFGHFAASYQRMFGELPSETLRRNA